MTLGRHALDTALGLRHSLLADDHDVARLEPAGPLDGVANESTEVVTLPDLGHSRERDDADSRHGRPVIFIPVCAL